MGVRPSRGNMSLTENRCNAIVRDVVSDNHGGSVGVDVTVTTTSGNISSVRRNPH